MLLFILLINGLQWRNESLYRIDVILYPQTLKYTLKNKRRNLGYKINRFIYK